MGEKKEHIYKWDNAKAFLILMVVWGHFVNEYARPADGDVIMKGISIFIYMFHMPCFIFLSGLFARRCDRKHPFPWERVFTYVILGYSLKVIIFLIKEAFGRNPDFLWLSDTGMPWYMFAMAAFMLLAFLLQDVDGRLVLISSVLIACLAGYCSRIGSFLNLSRIMVFFPYYYLGYLTDAGRLQERLGRKWIRALSAVILLVAAALIVGHTKAIYLTIRIFTGRNPYSRILLAWGRPGAGSRLLSYLVSLIMGGAVFGLMPERRIPLADRIGRRTLQIYFWHRLFLYLLVYSGFNGFLCSAFPGSWRILYLGIASLTVILFSAPPFAFPIDFARKMSAAIVGYLCRQRVLN